MALHNPYEILYTDDTSEQDTITDTTETKRGKVRSNHIDRVSVRKEQRYDDHYQITQSPENSSRKSNIC